MNKKFKVYSREKISPRKKKGFQIVQISKQKEKQIKNLKP